MKRSLRAMVPRALRSPYRSAILMQIEDDRWLGLRLGLLVLLVLLAVVVEGLLQFAHAVILAPIAEQALIFARLSPFVRPALVNGAAGVVVAPGGRPFSVMGFTVKRAKIVEIDVLADPDRLRQFDLVVLDD